MYLQIFTPYKTQVGALRNAPSNTQPRATDGSEHKCGELFETEHREHSLFIRKVTASGYPTAIFQVPKG